MGIGRGLLQRISAPEERHRAGDVSEAILVNLTSILNTHEGDGFTCPDMGCDFVELMSRWPTSEMDVITAVQRSISRYETRLEHVQVRRINRDSPRIELEITGRIRDPAARADRVRLQTELTRSGHVNIV
ncbi:MAG: GPW/gp25 family protein [Myxococcota bacterium]